MKESMDQEVQRRRAEDALGLLCDQKHYDIERRIGVVEKTLVSLQNRPPVWATLVMTIMGTIIGALLGHIASHIK